MRDICYTKSMNKTISTICAAAFFPAAILASMLTGLLLKSTNPSNVDVSVGLAYLGHQLLAGSIVGIILLVLAVIYASKANKTEGAGSGSLAFRIVAMNIVLAVLILAVNAMTLRTQNQYLIDHGKPTVDQFFKAAKEQKEQQ